MSNFHRLEVRIPGMLGSNSEVLIDGKPVLGVRRIEVSTGVAEATVVKIELLAAEMVLTVDADAARAFAAEPRDA